MLVLGVIKMPKQRCIKLYPNATFDDKKFGIDGTQIKDGKKRVGFTPACVLKENKPRWAFWRGQKSMILFVDGLTNALHFTEPTDKMQTHWTKEEANAYVKKQVALASIEQRMIKTWHFVVILLFLIVITILLARMSLALGV